MNLLPKEFVPFIVTFASLFSRPVWASALVLLVGALLALGKRTVSALLRGMGLHQDGDVQKYHWVLNRAVWSSRQASRLLLQSWSCMPLPQSVNRSKPDDPQSGSAPAYPQDTAGGGANRLAIISPGGSGGRTCVLQVASQTAVW